MVNVMTSAWDVYIGRPTKRFPQGSIWGNPFRVGIHGNLMEVLEKYRAYVLSSPNLISALPDLWGKRLGCYCVDRDGNGECHGKVLVDLVSKHVKRPRQQLLPIFGEQE